MEKNTQVKPLINNKENNLSLRLSHELVLDTETDMSVPFKSLWEDLPVTSEENTIVVLHFFRRFGWVICKMIAKEVSENVENLNKENKYNIKIKLIGIGIEKTSLEEFKKENYFKNNPIYINEGKSIYKNLKFKKNSICNCYGLSCKLLKMASLGKKDKIKNDLSGDKSQNGGEIAVISDGSIIQITPQDDPTAHMSLKDLEDLLEKAHLLFEKKKLINKKD